MERKTKKAPKTLRIVESEAKDEELPPAPSPVLKRTQSVHNARPLPPPTQETPPSSPLEEDFSSEDDGLGGTPEDVGRPAPVRACKTIPHPSLFLQATDSGKIVFGYRKQNLPEDSH